jgi:hypothetical protein
MVPAFLPQVPVDPYNGKELLMKATPTEFKVYSVGQNLVDDGGTWTDADLTDVGFVAPWRNTSPTDASQPAQPLPNEENQ